MTAPFFLDTNILVYATSLSPDHAPKRDAARAWVGRGDWGFHPGADGVLRAGPPVPDRPAAHRSAGLRGTHRRATSRCWRWTRNWCSTPWRCVTATTFRTGTRPSCAPRSAWVPAPWSAKTWKMAGLRRRHGHQPIHRGRRVRLTHCAPRPHIMTTVPISFEFFPPNTPVGSEKLKTVVQRTGAVQPEFFSVTYGAGGSTREKTLATVRTSPRWASRPRRTCRAWARTAPASPRSWPPTARRGIRRLVALRGDLPSGTATAGEFRYAAELVRFIREHPGRRLAHRGRRLPRVPPASSATPARPGALRRTR